MPVLLLFKNKVIWLIFLSYCLVNFTAFAQAIKNFKPETVEARVWSRDASGKVVYSDWKPFETRLVDNLIDFKPVSITKFCKYGGDPSRKLKGTGYFRVEKIKDRWWVIDPEGHPALHIAVNSVTEGKSKRNQQALKDKFGTSENWIKQTSQTILDLSFNGTGSWSDTEAIRKNNETAKSPIVYTINWNFMSAYGDKRGGTHQVPGHKAYPGGVIFVFDPAFEKFCDEHAKKLLAYKDDKNLYGHFSDNEMPLNLKNLDGYLSLKDNADPGYVAATNWLTAKGITPAQITDQHREEFLTLVADKYFSIVAKAIKKYDPNHLYLGSRFYANEKHNAAFMKTAGKYLDVVTLNYYGQWTPNLKHLQEWGDWTGRPFMVTEFYTKGMDSGLANMSGAGWLVKTQADRGKAYQNYCLGLLESKNCVGWHWFKYQDNDPTLEGAEPSNIDGNKGLLDNEYTLHKGLTDKMQQLNSNRYKLIEYFDKQNK